MAFSLMKTKDKFSQKVESVKELPAHDTKKTLSLNEARNIILILNKPMVETLQLINNNKKSVETVKNFF